MKKGGKEDDGVTSHKSLPIHLNRASALIQRCSLPLQPGHLIMLQNYLNFIIQCICVCSDKTAIILMKETSEKDHSGR